ncbi:MAG: ribbon-helix-helix protein, CopG family [Thermoflexales bacterium]|nr:ribbon-helix-helix protein, CopG family [Thermoflexales bacterium]
MRTTITLDDDVAARLIELQRQTGRSFKAIVNETLRLGLEQRARRQPRPRFKVVARPLGIRPGLNYANVGELIEQIEGPAHS